MRLVIRIIGLLFAAAAVMVAGIEMARSIQTGKWVITPLGKLWYDLSPGSLNLTQALLDIASDAKRLSHASDLKLGCLFVAPQKAQQGATPEELQDMVDDLQKEHSCAVAWYFPYAYRKLRNEAGNYHPGIAVLFKEARG